jgi:hypothetical protein
MGDGYVNTATVNTLLGILMNDLTKEEVLELANAAKNVADNYDGILAMAKGRVGRG